MAKTEILIGHLLQFDTIMITFLGGHCRKLHQKSIQLLFSALTRALLILHFNSKLFISGQNNLALGNDDIMRQISRHRGLYAVVVLLMFGLQSMLLCESLQLAALLSHIYYGDRAAAKVWPPSDYE